MRGKARETFRVCELKKQLFILYSKHFKETESWHYLATIPPSPLPPFPNGRKHLSEIRRGRVWDQQESLGQGQSSQPGHAYLVFPNSLFSQILRPVPAARGSSWRAGWSREPKKLHSAGGPLVFSFLHVLAEFLQSTNTHRAPIVCSPSQAHWS